jgi:hypothetical protein
LNKTSCGVNGYKRELYVHDVLDVPWEKFLRSY